MQDESPSSEKMRCKQCHGPLAPGDRVASISGSVMGDEYTDCYFLCPVCEVYTVMNWRDNFTGLETGSISGPLSKQKGDAQVALIRKCAAPWDKKCRCDAHVAHFGDSLD